MTRGLFGALALVGLSLVVWDASLGAAPGFWQIVTQADFLRGDADQVSIDEHGRLMLGPSVTKVHDPGVPVVWTGVTAPDGSTFLGTGNDGKVIRVDRSGTARVFFDSAELEAHALALAPDGALYVGTSPDGRVYRVDANGHATPFFDPEDKYIWSLAVDRQGDVYAGTGDKGVVYRITRDGKGDRFFATKALHAVTLAFDAGGRLLVGTGSPGRVFQVDRSGRGFLLLDTTYEEVRSIRADAKGVLYVAAQNGRAASGGEDRPEAPAAPPTPPPVPSVSTEITSFAIIDTGVSAQAAQTSPAADARRPGPTGAVYRVLPDGLWDELWTSREDAPYDVLFESAGGVLVATGPRGKLFRLAGDPVRSVLIARVPAQQATLLVPAPDRTYVTTANPGALMAISPARAARGTYESEVRDAKLVSTWGVIAWRAAIPSGTRVEIATRAGNARTPDDTWSDWTAPYASADGSPITSPKARYLQWRAVLVGTMAETPVLTSVTAAYQQRNVRPQVTSITVHPPGIVFQKPFSSGEAEIAGLDDDQQDRRSQPQQPQGTSAPGPALGRRVFQKGLQTFVWRAEDDNGDELTYEVDYRREGETTWRPLKTGLRDTLLVWDTTSVPNGTYVIRVRASDARSNAPETALVGELESNSFDVDNVAPLVTIGAIRQDGGRFVVTAEVRDTDSALSKVEYSVDAQGWRAAFPRDGILDARTETFDLRLEADSGGRTLVIRATDALGNVGTGQATVRAGGR
jgi:WD40 repeat protein